MAASALTPVAENSVRGRRAPSCRRTACVAAIVMVIASPGPPPLTITASTVASLATGSRSGPAGRQRPLPNRRSPSTTTTSARRAMRRCCRPSSATTTSAPSSAAFCTASARSRPTMTGAAVRRAMSTGSSPTAATSWSGRTRRGASPTGLAPWPRLTTAGCAPAACSCATSHSTSGVLPVPPAVRLPTTITGTGDATRRRSPTR